MKTWSDFVKEKLIPLSTTDAEYAKYVEEQQKAIAEYVSSPYRSKPTVKSREDWANQLEREWISEGPENIYPYKQLGEYVTKEVSGYFGEEGGPTDCGGVVGVNLNGELFFFEVFGYHDSWNGGELHWNEAKLIPTPDLTPEYIPGHYRYPGDWNTKALIKLGMSVPPLPDNK
jgi:hypothetical protein